MRAQVDSRVQGIGDVNFVADFTNDDADGRVLNVFEGFEVRDGPRACVWGQNNFDKMQVTHWPSKISKSISMVLRIWGSI